MKTFTYTLNEIEQVAATIATNLKHDSLLFYGPMGAGKTTLIKALCTYYQINDVISSPTFSLVNEYTGPKHNIFHFDFYRIDDENEAFDIGFEEYLASTHLKFIEWPERIPNLLPEEFHKISISILDENTRELTISEVKLV